MVEKKRIIIVEHDIALRDTIAKKLETEGYLIDYAGNGVIALEKIRATKPHAILLELLTPRKSGVEVLEEMNGDPELKSIPVVVIASFSQATEMARAKELGVHEFLVKEIFNPQEIVEKLAHLLKAGNPTPVMPSVRPAVQYVTPTPSAKVPASAVAAAPRRDNTANAGIYVLVVEDDKFLRELLVRKLASEKFTVENAIDAEAAFAILAKDRVPNIILLDLILPVVSGFDILAKVKSDPKTAAVPVIILSNLGQKEDIDRAKSLGAYDFMVKANFTLDEIVEKIHTVVG